MLKIQQGDVILRPVRAIPAGAKLRGDHHLAEGEVTGHYHEACGADVAVFEHEDQLYLDAPQACRITHQEHHPVDVPAGSYIVSRVREYDHFAEEARIVVD